jgi:ribosomal protein S18 acetylase RimI-like enzyme
MQLRLATTADLPLLAQWYKELRSDERIDNTMTDGEVRGQMDSFLRGSTYKTYLLEDGGAAVGYGMLDVTRKPMYLRHLFVHREKRQKGYGKKLIYLLMNLFAISDIDIEVMVWNQNALEFYNKLGFRSRYLGMRLHRDES